jgi:Flp pilus assembly protein TadG
MLATLPRRPAARRGATLVEAALVISVFLLFLFGVFEYCRYLLVLHVATNAARDGVRYATVNVSRPYNFDTTDATFVDSFGVTQPLRDSTGAQLESITKFTTKRMGGVDRMLTGREIATYPCEPAGLYTDPPTFTPKTGWTPDPNTRTVHWNDAQFTERIAVRITGTYKPLLPSFLFMNSSGFTNFRVVAVMGSEG